VLLDLINSDPAEEEDGEYDPPFAQIERSAPSERRQNDKPPLTQEGAKQQSPQTTDQTSSQPPA